ncbi:RusA family crossover junction endodeoxyribonuclease [Marinitoga sp. 1155]|uniref:RusA family crossover junction endodeoxyribonuclease n=1 Tax=Marinitoga sp. 1155 TaxID=1428448 RepID=UPI000641241A|nr:RusA family crossover junction endodeoxyribonuclease [Marinitoga sp. 1155]AJW76981.1 hypothetical protein UF09_15 [Marinitoga camini virus 2]KLO24806.1 hypothetical protein X274_02330 [Marinitoga sp. 1155]
MKLKIELDCIPPSTNHAYKKRGNGYGMYMTRTAKEFKEYAAYKALKIVRKYKVNPFPNDKKFYKLHFEFHFKNRRHPDPNNLLKILIDSLEGIVFENDRNIDVSTTSKITGKEKTIIFWER